MSPVKMAWTESAGCEEEQEKERTKCKRGKHTLVPAEPPAASCDASQEGGVMSPGGFRPSAHSMLLFVSVTSARTGCA